MDEKTLKALKASIKHLEENTNVKTLEEASLGIEDHPLCSEFYNKKGSCNGCPVFIARYWGCGKSPYDEVYESFIDKDLNAFHAAAKKELAFLKSLLPDDQKQDDWQPIGNASNAVLAKLAQKAAKK